MKKFKKIALFSLLLLSLGLVSCVDKRPDENGDGTNNDILLPDKENPVISAKEEIIYVNIKQNGVVENIQASNKIKDTEFKYYEDYGVFLNEGNLNISSNKGEIIIEENRALIPSLSSLKNFYYILSLDKDYYEEKLPFNIDFEYQLDGKVVGYSELIGASGIVDMKIKFTVNEAADDYYKSMFGAQVQIPFNSEKVEIIEAENVLTKVVVAKTITLAYMAMPGQNQEINLKLKVNDFGFDGIQATYQEFSISDLLKSFINLEDFDLSQIDELRGGVDLIIAEFSNAKLQTDQLFWGLSLLTEENLRALLNVEKFSELSGLIEALNSSSFGQGLRLPAQAVKYVGITNRDQYVNKYNNFQVKVTDDITNITKSYERLMIALDQIEQLINDLDTINGYATKYLKFEDIISDLSLIKKEISKIGTNLSLEDIISNKDQLVLSFKTIGELNDKIKVSFQTLIMEMSTLPYHVSKLSCLFDLIKELGYFVDYAVSLDNNLTDLVKEIKLDQQASIFSSLYESGLNQFVNGLENGDGENPGLLEALKLIISEMGVIKDLGELDQLLLLLEEDEITKRRLIDDVLRGFIEMNKALTLAQEGQTMSFYDGLSLVAYMGSLLEELPDLGLNSNLEKTSFLSELNLPPIYTQFIVKQQPF